MFSLLVPLLAISSGLPSTAASSQSSSSSIAAHAPTLDFTGASWIWPTNTLGGDVASATRALRKTLSLSSSPAPISAEFVLAADDSFNFYVNGNQIDSKAWPADDWEAVYRYCVPVQVGQNVIALQVHDGPAPAGLAAALKITFEDGTATHIVTDTTWKANLGAPTGFQQIDFDDSSWSAAGAEAARGSFPDSLTLPPAINCPTTPPSSSNSFPSRFTISKHNSSSVSRKLTHPHHHGSKKTHAIVGGTIAGIAGLVVVVIIVVGCIGLKNLRYLWASLASALFGRFLFRSRRLIFLADGHLPPTQLSLFLTHQKKISDNVESDPEKILVWKVLTIGGAQPPFEVTVPSMYKEGSPQLGFGTVEASSDGKAESIECINVSLAPAELDDDLTWNPLSDDDEKNLRKKPVARNMSQKASRMTVGTIDETGINPFLLVEHSAFSDGSEYHAKSALYLHVFRTNAYSGGMYKDTLIKDIEGDRLTSPDGIRIKSLSPLTSWHIRAGDNGKLKFKIVSNSKEDVMRYRHECMIQKEVKAKLPPA